MFYLGHLDARRRLQTPFRQGNIHGRGDVSLIFELHRQRFKCRIKRHAFDFFTRDGPAAQLQLHKLVARIPIVTRCGNRVATRNFHGHNRQALVGFKPPGGAAMTAERPNTKGNHQHGKHRKTNRDKAMVRTAFLGRYIPLCLSI